MLACVGVKAQLAEGKAPFIGAQVVDLSTITTTDYYVMVNVGRSGRVMSAPNATENIKLTDRPNVEEQTTEIARGSVIQFEAVEGKPNTYKIKFCLIEKYVPVFTKASAGVPASDEGDEYVIGNAAAFGEFTFKGTNFAFNGNAYEICGYTYGTSGNAAYRLYKVILTEPTELASVTYNCTFTGGGLAENLTYTQTVENALPRLKAPDVKADKLLLTGSDMTVDTESAATINLTYTMNYPFTLSNPGDDGALNGAAFYTAYLKDNQNLGVCYVDETHTSCTTPRAIDANYMWCFVADTQKPWQVKMYNLGALKYATVAAGNNSKLQCDATGATAATSFNVLAKDANGFILQHSGNANSCLGAHANDGANGYGANSLFGIWDNGSSPTATGSKIVVQPVDDASFMHFNLDFAAPEFVGNPTAPSSLKDVLATYAGTPSLENLKAYVSAYRAASDAGQMMLGLEEGKYYRLLSNRSFNVNAMITAATAYAGADGVVTSVNNTDEWRKIYRVPTDKSDLSALWTPVLVEGKTYKFRNANTGKCMGEPKYMPLEDQWAGNWTLDILSEDGRVTLQLNGGSDYLHDWGGASVDSKEVGTWTDGASDAGNIWKIQAVTSIPVTIGAAGWSSLVLPYAVELPEGVQAYYAEGGVTGIELDLTEWTTTGENGKVVVPANMPVFLCGTAGEVNLTITTTEVAAPANTLKGFTMARHSDSGEFAGVYALRAGEDLLGKVTADVTDFPANRVFVEGVADGASLVRLAFGETTGIEDVPAAELNAKNEAYYDLSGRRVWAPKNGIFVTASGRKVFIK